MPRGFMFLTIHSNWEKDQGTSSLFAFLIRNLPAWLGELSGPITTSAEAAGGRDREKCWWKFSDHKLFSPQVQGLSFQTEIQAYFSPHGLMD